MVSTVVLGNDPVNPLAVLILNGLDAGPHLLRNMRAEERPDGVALPAVALAISAVVAPSGRLAATGEQTTSVSGRRSTLH